MRTLVRKFWSDTQGAMTVEFVIWVPLLMAWFVVSATAYSAFDNRHAAANAAFTIADISSRQITMDDTVIDDLYSLQANLLPGVSDQRTLRVSSIMYNEPLDMHVLLWSEARGPAPELNQVTVPLGWMPQMADGDTVLLVETSVPYSFISEWIGSETTLWTHVLPVRPRYVGSVVKTDEPSVPGV